MHAAAARALLKAADTLAQTRTHPTRARSPRQQEIAANLSLASRTWRTLSDSQRQTWTGLGQTWSPTPGSPPPKASSSFKRLTPFASTQASKTSCAMPPPSPTLSPTCPPSPWTPRTRPLPPVPSAPPSQAPAHSPCPSAALPFMALSRCLPPALFLPVSASPRPKTSAPLPFSTLCPARLSPLPTPTWPNSLAPPRPA